MRAEPLLQLLKSVKEQTKYPDEILIIDGSTNEDTEVILGNNLFDYVKYYSVPPQYRGLTKQRNFGIERVAADTDIICFLDDDIVLTATYFEELLKTYQIFPEALGVGGYILDETKIEFVGEKYHPKIDEIIRLRQLQIDINQNFVSSVHQHLE